ncbi:hypothetical protein LINPERPRIM_LOCUS9134 [Linum perenne]
MEREIGDKSGGSNNLPEKTFTTMRESLAARRRRLPRP